MLTKQERRNDADTVEQTSLILLGNTGVNPHKDDPLHRKQVERLLDKIRMVVPEQVDCGVVMLKTSHDDKIIFVGGYVGNIDELNALEGLISSRMEHLRLTMEDKLNNKEN